MCRMPDIGAELRAARMACRLTQGALARRVGKGMHGPYICALERGLYTPRIDTLVRIARALGESQAFHKARGCEFLQGLYQLVKRLNRKG